MIILIFNFDILGAFIWDTTYNESFLIDTIFHSIISEFQID